MNFKNITQKVPALKFLMDHTPILSNVGEKALHSSPFYLKTNQLEAELENISVIIDWYFSLENSAVIIAIAKS